MTTRQHGEMILDPVEEEWAMRHFDVPLSQVRHDFVVSHLLSAVSLVDDAVIFYGGTALSRTILPDLRLSEDIDLLSVGSRQQAAQSIDEAVRGYFRRHRVEVDAEPWLAQVKRDTQACLFRIDDIEVKVQLIDGRHYTPWPTQVSAVEQRYASVPETTLLTLTPPGFVGAKTSAWIDRNTPRDLYDLWALHEQGFIDGEAARLYRRIGPTNSYPGRHMLPIQAPAEEEWMDALSHQCVPQVTAQIAYETVVSAWQRAIALA